jgi:hypothetical protein
MFSTNSSWSTNCVAQEELEEDPLQQVMATTSEEELSLLNLSNVATYFNQVEKEESVQDLEQEPGQNSPLLLSSNSCQYG